MPLSDHCTVAIPRICGDVTFVAQLHVMVFPVASEFHEMIMELMLAPLLTPVNVPLSVMSPPGPINPLTAPLSEPPGSAFVNTPDSTRADWVRLNPIACPEPPP